MKDTIKEIVGGTLIMAAAVALCALYLAATPSQTSGLGEADFIEAGVAE